jgi:hypothetical protein
VTIRGFNACWKSTPGRDRSRSNGLLWLLKDVRDYS